MITVTMTKKEIIVNASMSVVSELCHVLKANRVRHKYRIIRGGIAFPRKCAYDVLYEMSTMFTFRID